MIYEVDEALRGMLDEESLSGSGVEVSFEAPTRDWAARRNAPTVNVFLYDIREDLAWRQDGMMQRHDEVGRVVAEFEPPRCYALSYLVTAWTNRAQDEHRLLAALLSDLIRRPVLPRQRLNGSLAELGMPVPMTVAVPPAQERGIADIWSAIGGALKPSLDLVITAPLAAGSRVPAPPVTDGLVVRAVDTGNGAQVGTFGLRYEDAGLEGGRSEGGGSGGGGSGGLVVIGSRRARGAVPGSRPIGGDRS